jgi:hypothetical protein
MGLWLIREQNFRFFNSKILEICPWAYFRVYTVYQFKALRHRFSDLGAGS